MGGSVVRSGALLGLIRECGLAPFVRRANILSNNALSGSRGGGTRGVARTTRFDRYPPGLLHQSLALELVNDLPASCLVPDRGHHNCSRQHTASFPRDSLLLQARVRCRCAKAR